MQPPPKPLESVESCPGYDETMATAMYLCDLSNVFEIRHQPQTRREEKALLCGDEKCADVEIGGRFVLSAAASADPKN